ncbi:MAG: DNA repair protein RadA [Pygmaiobacter sp.]
MKEKTKTIYVCNTCGEQSPRWLGRCPSCGQWNTMVEDVIRELPASKTAAPRPVLIGEVTSARLCDINTTDEQSRIITGIHELDRVLGGGLVIGSVVLLGGEPGAGKSTLLLQICAYLSGDITVLYVTGEESIRQIKLRADRLHVSGNHVTVAAETEIETIVELIRATKPQIVVVDSIQTMHSAAVSSSAGSVSQVKECSAQLLTCAKTLEIPIFIVGHVNKDGAIAGPKVMEHIVDTVLYFEGDRMLPYRILRAVKNRYGSTNEIGMFDMTGTGLKEILNPSQMLLEGRPLGVSGNCVACTMEGTRPILSEIQALVTKTSFGTPRRTASGFDFNRANLLLAVLEKRAGYFMGNLDVYLNIVGGLELDDTACDLSVVLAVVSSLLDKPISDTTLAIGEVGLGGEVRSINNLDARVREALRIGFTRVILPKHSMSQLNLKEFSAIELCGVSYIRQAIDLI